MKRDTIAICGTLILCTLSLIGYWQYPEWARRHDAAVIARGTLELNEIQHSEADPMPALQQWLDAHPSHPLRNNVRLVLMTAKDSSGARQSMAMQLRLYAEKLAQ